MPTRRIQRGPATGGPPVDFTNAANWNEIYVDGLTDQFVVGTGISGSTGSPLARAGAPTLAPVTFANLPAAPVEGMVYVVTDAAVNTWGTVIAAGGGANRVLAYYNGAAWTVAGK